MAALPLTPGPWLHRGAPLASARGAMVLLHGRGSSAAEIARLADHLAAPGVAFLLPEAPSLSRGSWYPQRFLAPRAANEPQFSAALATVEAAVGELLVAGLPPARIAVGGFSQGACLALEHAAAGLRPLAFVAALSGALPGPLDAPRAPGRLPGLPVLLACADDDAHIPREHVDASAAWFAAAGAAVTRLRFPGAHHGLFPEELVWLRAQVAERLAGT